MPERSFGTSWSIFTLNVILSHYFLMSLYIGYKRKSDEWLTPMASELHKEIGPRIVDLHPCHTSELPLGQSHNTDAWAASTDILYLEVWAGIQASNLNVHLMTLMSCQVEGSLTYTSLQRTVIFVFKTVHFPWTEYLFLNPSISFSLSKSESSPT